MITTAIQRRFNRASILHANVEVVRYNFFFFLDYRTRGGISLSSPSSVNAD